MKFPLPIFGMFSFLIVQDALAQSFDTPPPIAAPRPANIAEPFVTTMGNGLRVVVAQRRGLPLVTATLVVRTGTEADPVQLAGLANTSATLLTKGTARRTAPQIAEAAEALGGQLESRAGWHRTMVSITVTGPQLPAALDLMADAVLHPQFARAEIERARKLALDAVNIELAKPETLARMAADRAAFGGSAYGHPASGTPASLARIQRKDVLALYARIFRPDNVTLIFAGDIDPKDAERLAGSAFGRWSRPSTPISVVTVAAPQPIAQSPIVIAMPGAGQAGVVVATSSIARDAPDYYSGVVANTLLGSGFSSRLSQEIRIKRGLSYHPSSQLDARREGGEFAATVQTKNASAAEVVALVLGEIATIGAKPAPVEELDARKLALIGAFGRSLETTQGLASQLASLESTGMNVAEIVRLIDQVRQVTPLQVQAFAKLHWPKEGMRVVVAGDAPQFVDTLRASYTETVLVGPSDIDLDAPRLLKPVAN